MENTDLKIVGTNFYLKSDDANLIKVRAKFSKTHLIEAILGTKVKLKNLKDGQSVIFGDGQSYHFRLTNLPF